MTDEQLRVLIVDDHPAFREGLRALLASAEHISVVDAATSGAEAIRLADKHQPDVVLMDLHMPELNGIEGTRQIVQASPHIGVLVLTMFDDDDSVFAALRVGARGYLLKGAGRDEIVRAITAIARGEAIFGPPIAHRIARYFAREPQQGHPFPQLTERERELLALVAAGHDNAAIARRLYLSPKTVRNHVSNIFNKLQVAGRAEAIIVAREAGLGRSSRPWSP